MTRTLRRILKPNTVTWAHLLFVDICPVSFELWKHLCLTLMYVETWENCFVLSTCFSNIRNSWESFFSSSNNTLEGIFKKRSYCSNIPLKITILMTMTKRATALGLNLPELFTIREDHIHVFVEPDSFGSHNLQKNGGLFVFWELCHLKINNNLCGLVCITHHSDQTGKKYLLQDCTFCGFNWVFRCKSAVSRSIKDLQYLRI